MYVLGALVSTTLTVHVQTRAAEVAGMQALLEESRRDRTEEGGES